MSISGSFQGQPVVVLPSTKIQNIEWICRNNQSVTTNPFSSAQQVISWETGYLECTLSYPPLTDSQAREMIAFLLQLRQSGVFEFGDPLGQQPFGVPSGSPVVNGSQNGTFSLSTRGWSVSTSNLLSAGDWISIGSPGYLYRVLDDVSSDASGQATLSVWPEIKNAVDGQTIITSNTKGVWRLSSNESKWSQVETRLHGLSFTIREALAGVSPSVVPLPIPPATIKFGAGRIIDGSQPAASQGQHDLFRKYNIAYGGNLWALIFTQRYDGDGLNDQLMGIYKSTDSGVTWVRQDEANAPTGVVFANYWRAPGSSEITIVYSNRNSVSPYTETIISLVTFDMATGLYGTPTTPHNFFFAPSGAGSGAPFAFLDNQSLYKMSNGHFRFLFSYRYTDTFFPLGTSGQEQSDVYWTEWDGSSWSALTLFPLITPAWGQYCSLDYSIQSGDLIHCGYSIAASLFAAPDRYYVQLKSDGTFSTPVHLNPIVGAPFFQVNDVVISGNALLIPTSSTLADGVLRGTPLSAPVFTFIPFTNSNTGYDDIKILHQTSPARDVVVWVIYDPITGDNGVFWLTLSTDGGLTWTTPEVCLNLDVTPVVPSPYDTFHDLLDVNSMSLGQNVDGSVGLMFTSWATYYAPTTHN